MRKGFTIIELLVASMLLGLLVTILTMIFNQSSISWRIGTAMIGDMDDIRDNMAEIREEADNAFAYNGELYRHVGLWDSNGDLHTRAACGDTLTCSLVSDENRVWKPNYLQQRKSQLTTSANRNPWNWSQNAFNVGMVRNQQKVNNYTVNVMSGGPANDIKDWQAIWSFPDDPTEW